MLRTTRLSAVLALGMSAALVASVPVATAADVPRPIAKVKAPRGLDVLPGGDLVVARGNGSYGIITRAGAHHGDFTRLGHIATDFPPALDVNKRGEIFVLTTGGESTARGAASLYRWTKAEGQKKIADIAAYQATDQDPYDLEKKPKDSNPYGVAALDDGTALVADAGGNDLLRVWPNGDVKTIALVKPRTVKVPRGLGKKAPPPGTPMPSEAVVTSVTVGRDGFYYIGELRGFPGTPRTSQIWRIDPDADRAVCDPAHPFRGDCRRVVKNMTSVVALQAGAGGSLFVVELSKTSWVRAESGNPADSVGALIRLGRDRSNRHELARNRLILPGDVALDRRGRVFVTTPIFGMGQILRVR